MADVFVPNQMHIGLFRANSILLVAKCRRGGKKHRFQRKGSVLLQVSARGLDFELTTLSVSLFPF